MNRIITTTVIYSIASVAGLSFYLFIFKLLFSHAVLGVAILAAFVCALAIIIRDNQLLQST